MKETLRIALQIEEGDGRDIDDGRTTRIRSRKTRDLRLRGAKKMGTGDTEEEDDTLRRPQSPTKAIRARRSIDRGVDAENIDAAHHLAVTRMMTRLRTIDASEKIGEEEEEEEDVDVGVRVATTTTTTGRRRRTQ